MDDDQPLLARWVQDRNEEAFATLVRRYTPLVWAACRRQLADAASADDAAQAVFLLLATRAPRLLARPWWGPTALADWLHACALRTASNARRARTRRTHHEHQVAHAMPDAHHPLTEPDLAQDGSLDDALRALSRRYREPLVMHYLAARSRPEIARELTLSEDAVHKRIERGLATLRKRLDSRTLGALLAAPLVHQALANEHCAPLLARLVRSGPRLAAPSSVGTPTVALLAAGVALVVAGGLWFSGARHLPGMTQAAASIPPPASTVAAVTPDPLATPRARGIVFLLAHQDPTSGQWQENLHPPMAVTALVIRALDTVVRPAPELLHARARGVAWLAAQARIHHGNLASAVMPAYSQALGTLVLAEHARDLPDGIELCRQACGILLAGQSAQGGWRYALDGTDADVSVTGDVVLALCAAQRQGACDATAALDRAHAYLQSCFEPLTGGFSYCAGQHGPQWPTADTPPVHKPGPTEDVETTYRIALASLALGRLAGPSLTTARAHEALAQGWDDESFGLLGDAFADESLGDDPVAMPRWAAWAFPYLLKQQAADGSWSDHIAGPVLGTALALRALTESPADAGWQTLPPLRGEPLPQPRSTATVAQPAPSAPLVSRVAGF